MREYIVILRRSAPLFQRNHAGPLFLVVPNFHEASPEAPVGGLLLDAEVPSEKAVQLLVRRRGDYPQVELPAIVAYVDFFHSRWISRVEHCEDKCRPGISPPLSA